MNGLQELHDKQVDDFMKKVLGLLVLINDARRKKKLAGEIHKTWQHRAVQAEAWADDAIPVPTLFVVDEVVSIYGAPREYREITPHLNRKETEIFLRGALIALDNDADTEWPPEF